jgi:hypothetical protein
MLMAGVGLGLGCGWREDRINAAGWIIMAAGFGLLHFLGVNLD